MPITNFNIVKKQNHILFKQTEGQQVVMLPVKDQVLLSKLLDVQEKFVFSGYPSGNLLKQVCVVMCLWQQSGRFPVKFLEITSLQDHDQTEHLLQNFDKLTSLINEIFGDLIGSSEKSPRALQKDICEFLCLLEPRGFLTCLGVRKTVGSYDSILPPDLVELEEMYNRPNKIYTEEELANHPNPSVLTVGARAIQKHAARPSQWSGYWVEKGSMNGMTEKDKNEKASQVIGNLLKTC